MRAALVILIILCLGLGAGLVIRHKKAIDQKEKLEAGILQMSNSWTHTSSLLDAQVQDNSGLTNKLQQKTSELESTSKELNDTKATLAKSQAEAEAAAKAVKAAEAEITKRDTKINELESQNVALDKQANELKTAITGLEGKIADTQKKLAASEGDREFLLKELKRLQAEKAELERQFNDLVVLKEQVRKLKEELAISKRLEWLRRGLYTASSLKGAELLQHGVGKELGVAKTNQSVNVEMKRDGTTTINAPGTPPPKK
jgi:chromosome segregation ATPase